MKLFPTLLGPFAAATLAAVLAASTPFAHALPAPGSSCQITTYYADASMTTQVGSFSNCPGSAGLKGHRTAFFEVDDVQVTPVGPKPPGPKPLPCEFQKDCVVNLPTPIVVHPWPPKKK